MATISAKKYFALTALILLLAFALSEVRILLRSLEENYITVRIIDLNDCLKATHNLLFKEKTVFISGDQINHGPSQIGGNTDTVVKVLAEPDQDGFIRYRIETFYRDLIFEENCEVAVGEEERVVKPGWLIYETIDGRQIVHQVRSK